MRQVSLWIPAIAGIAVLGTAPAAAAPAAADFQVFVTAGTTNSNQQVIQSGGTANVPISSFKAGAIVDNNGGDEATASLRFELASGLRFGADAPDARESCSATESTAECTTPLTIGTDPSRRSSGWVWDVVAERAGSYVLRAEIVQTSTTDPDLSSNTASATIVVGQPSGGDNTPAAASASAVRLSPTKPKAGSSLRVTVRVTAGGTAIRPSAVACAGTIGRTTLRGVAGAGSGVATCLYRPPRSAKGKTLRGVVSLTARGTRFTKRFVAKLG